MFWSFVLVLIVFIIIKFTFTLYKDYRDLKNQPLFEKLEVVVNTLNDKILNGNGKITKMNMRSFYLSQPGYNEIMLTFLYGAGTLTIEWKCVFLEDELSHKKVFNNVRKLDSNQQQRLAKLFISEITQVINNHISV